VLDPKNPDVFWVFASVLHDEGDNCGARELIEKGLGVGLSDPAALADAGRIVVLCSLSDSAMSVVEKTQLRERAEGLYWRAVGLDPASAYIYSSWATAEYLRGNYEEAWAKVKKARVLGGDPGGQFLALLSAAMPEPN
jgi:tetratricopeptide (TPR) repeat protein